MTSHHPATARVLDAIQSWDPLHGPTRWSDDDFGALALALFDAQLEGEGAYTRFCHARGVSAASALSSWRDIPAAPTDAFKQVDLSVAGAGASVRTFRTSGTTAGLRGAHHFATLDVYSASLAGPFRRWVHRSDGRVRIVALAPSPRDLPDSSLSYMLGELIDRFGTPDSVFCVTSSGSGLTLDATLAHRAFDDAVASGEPVCVLGTAFGFVEVLDATSNRWELPAGSCVMETGGFKGRTREITRGELYASFTDRLGVPAARCVSEYSMTELSSQSYTDNLERSDLGSPWSPGVLRTPPWARIEVVDPVRLEVLEGEGARGLIRWYDLANVGSVIAVQTSDVGVRVAGGGIRLEGRAPDSELRGCSLTIEEIVDATR
jgi:hypothetical protein